MNLLRKIKTPAEALHFVRQKISREVKIAFVSSIVISLICHLYAFVNEIINHDGFSRMIGPANYTYLGRWFTSPVGDLSTRFSVPWILALFTFFYYALVVVFIVKTFSVKNTWVVIGIAAVTICFPAVAANNAYRHQSDIIAMGMLLSVISIYLAGRWKFGCLAGGVVLGFSMGIYPAFLPYAMMLVIIQLLIQLSSSTYKWKNILRSGTQYIITGVLGLGVYYICLRIIVAANNVVLASYQGIDGILSPKLDFLLLPTNLKRSYDEFYRILTASSIFRTSFEKFVVLMFLLFLIAILVYSFISNKLYKSPPRIILVLILLAAIPCVLNIYYVLGDERTVIHLLMKTAYSLLFIIPMVLCDKLLTEKKWGASLLQWGTIITTTIICILFFFVSNISYYNAKMRFDKEYSYWTRVAHSVEISELYFSGMPVLFHIDEVTALSEYPPVDAFNKALGDMTGLQGNVFIYNSSTAQAFLSYFGGVTFSPPNIEQYNAIRASEELKAMPYWPNEGSIQIIENVFVMKLPL